MNFGRDTKTILLGFPAKPWLLQPRSRTCLTLGETQAQQRRAMLWLLETGVRQMKPLLLGLALAAFVAIPPTLAAPPDGYVKVWGDEFDEPNLDAGKWYTRYVYNGGTLDHLNDEQERYRDAGTHVMTGHSVQLTALPKGADGLYPSGMLRSREAFDLNAGIYIEARLKMPAGLGTWDGFWLAPMENADGSGPAWPPEIDIMETVNNGRDDTTSMYNTSAKVGNWKVGNHQVGYGAQGLASTFTVKDFNSRFNAWYASIDFSKGFHTIGFWYDAGAYTIFVDGKKIYAAKYKWVDDAGNPSPRANIQLDLAVGGHWAGRYGIDDNAFPQALEAEYVRVFQKDAGTRSSVGVR